MLLLVIRNWKVQRSCSFQWHDVHNKFYEKPSISLVAVNKKNALGPRTCACLSKAIHTEGFTVWFQNWKYWQMLLKCSEVYLFFCEQVMLHWKKLE